MSEISLDDYKAMVGQEVGVSRWFEVSQGRIDTFADVTEDHQFIHVDPERANVTPFGGTVAHGLPDHVSACANGLRRPAERRRNGDVRELRL